MKIIKKIINDVPVTYIKTDKFKSIMGALHFKIPFNNDSGVKRILLKNIMIYNCKKYPTNELLNINCFNNYDANYSSKSARDGNCLTTSFEFSVVNDKFIDDKNNTKRVVDTFLEILFNPNVIDKKFEKETFELCKKRFEEALKREKENPDAYSFHELYKLMDEKKPYAFRPTIKDLKQITSENLYKEYLSMLNESEVSLYLIGDFNYEELADKITKKIKKNTKYNVDIQVQNNFKDKVKEAEDTLLTSSSVLTYGFKCKNLTDFERKYVMPIYSGILGGGASSRCFNEIREKNSLAYYCSSSYKKLDGLLTIHAGIKKENKDKTLNLMKKVQKSMKKITENELVIIKNDIESSLKQNKDSYVNLLGIKYFTDLTNEEWIDERIKLFNSVTIKDVENVHKKVIADSIYFVKGEK